ncbi:MAG: acyltransferase family protein [Lachnospiraceae bacterium]|nr:acyltransferase family protein [Lachnospiraceae bacterium]
MQIQNSNRQSNIELLRILLMIAILNYHLMLYNGVWFHEYNTNTLIGIMISVIGAIPADYCFIAMSSYFLLKENEKPCGHLFGKLPVYKKSIHRFWRFLTLCLSMYVIKVLVLRGLFGYNNKEYFVDVFLMKGAWWYVYPYLCLLLAYPYLNKLMQKINSIIHLMLVAFLGLGFIWISYRNETIFVYDLWGFLFDYVLVAYILRKDGESLSRRFYGVCSGICAGFLLGCCIFVCVPYHNVSLEQGHYVISLLVGRYSFPAVLMGIFTFFFVLKSKIPYKKWINKIASITMFVFLLHDTWMGVFWYLGKCDNQYVYYSTPTFIFWGVMFVATAFLVSGIIGTIYKSKIQPLWEKAIRDENEVE